MSTPSPDDGPPSPPVSLRPEPPELAAFDRDIAEAKSPFARAAAITEHLRGLIEQSIRSKREMVDAVGELSGEVGLLSGLVRNAEEARGQFAQEQTHALAGLTTEVGRLRGSVDTLAEQSGGIARELAEIRRASADEAQARARQDSHHDERISEVTDTAARAVVTAQQAAVAAAQAQAEADRAKAALEMVKARAFALKTVGVGGAVGFCKVLIDHLPDLLKML